MAYRPLRPLDNVTQLPLSRDSIAQQLKAAGFATGMFAKGTLRRAVRLLLFAGLLGGCHMECAHYFDGSMPLLSQAGGGFLDSQLEVFPMLEIEPKA
ncbi:MAG: hypothetical protein ACK5OC_25340 [Pirellula sp.]